MKHNLVLTITALLSVLLASFHLSDDIVLGIEPGGVSNFNGILIVSVILSAQGLWRLQFRRTVAARVTPA